MEVAWGELKIDLLTFYLDGETEGGNKKSKAKYTKEDTLSTLKDMKKENGLKKYSSTSSCGPLPSIQQIGSIYYQHGKLKAEKGIAGLNKLLIELKKELETPSKVLRDQTQRRKLLASGGAAGGSGINGGGGGMTNNFATNRGGQPTIATATRLPTISQTKKASQFQSPLFTSTQPGGVAASAAAGSGGRHKNNPTNNAYSGYAGYGGSSSTTMASYGGTTTSAPSSFGMRQRKQQQQQQQQQPTTTKSHIQIDSGNDDSDDKYTKNGNNNESTTIQQQIQLRRENRATKNRAAQARLAERSIAELGVMFTKMSSLISQQGEILERIEDDVEAAGLDIDAGHDELVKVYGMTKGNRGLILKVFGILIFLIIFMKLY